MANVLGKLFSDIANSIREKTGDTAAMKPAEFPKKIWEIDKSAILKEQRFDGFVMDDQFGAYSPGYMTPSPFVLNSGETYHVVWDDVEWKCTAVQVSNTDVITTVIGNGYTLGLPDTGEPFLIVYNRVANGDGDSSLFFSNEGDDFHTVGIWQNAIRLQDKTVTENGEYTADDGFDGLGKVTVNVAGSGGGTLPAGVYWEQDKAGLPFQYSPRMFMYEGELYAYGRTGTATSTGVLYKLVNGAWSKVGGSYTLPSGYFYPYPIEYNGKVHLLGGDSSGHYTYDKTNGFAQKANAPGSVLLSGAFVQDGKLKAFVYRGTYGDSVYVWDEETDTWELEADFGKSGEVYRMFAVVDGTVYVLYNKQLFTYSDGALTYVRDITCSGSFINGYSSPALVVGKYVYGYYINSGKRLCKVDIENGVQIELGRLPEIYTNGSENQLLFLADRIRLTSKNEDIKNKVSLIMHEVTE